MDYSKIIFEFAEPNTYITHILHHNGVKVFEGSLTNCWHNMRVATGVNNKHAIKAGWNVVTKEEFKTVTPVEPSKPRATRTKQVKTVEEPKKPKLPVVPYTDSISKDAKKLAQYDFGGVALALEYLATTEKFREN